MGDLNSGGRAEDPARRKRVTRYKKGRAAELLAALYLLAKGYCILEWRARGPAGEIDLIARRGRRLAFVEVKYRRTISEAQHAISPAQQQRLIRAAQNWVGRRPRYHDHEIGMDAIFVAPWRWPRHEVNVFYEM